MTVVELVERERARLRRLYILAGLALAVGATCMLLAAGASALGGARWISMPRGTPFAIWLAVLVVDVAVVAWTIRRLDRRATRQNVAAAIEREQSLRAGALRGVIEVADSGALGRKAAAALSDRLSSKAGKLAVGERRLVRRGAAQATGAATVAAAALAFAVPNFNDGMSAIMQPMRAWNGTLLPRLSFDKLPPDVLRGEMVRIRVSALHRSTVSLTQRVPGEAWTTQTLVVDPRTGIASLEIGPLRGDLTVVASDGRTASDTGVVHVTDRPFVGAVSMRASYPAYLGRPAENLPIGEPAKVPQGTAIDVTGRASAALRSVRLAASGDTIKLDASDRTFTGRFAARHSGHYAWIATGATGPIADVPAPVDLEVVPDSAPRVDLVAPATDTLVAGDDRITLRVTATDDHGLAVVEMTSWASSWMGQRPPMTQKTAESAGTVWNGSTTLDLGQLKLKPGDALHVKFIATDNSPWAQHGESRELLLKIPTLEERRAIARDAMDSAVSQVRAAAQAEKSLQDRTSDAARERQRTPADAPPPSGKQGNMSYEAAEKAKAVAKDQRELADQVKNLQQTAASLEQQLKQAGALDSALQRQLQEAQQMLRDALTPELMAQMQKLDNATQQLSREQSQQALKDMQAMQQRLREQLEKSAEMLKRAALEGSMETLKDEAKEIAQKDKALADSANAKASDAQKQQAKQLADRSQRFSDELKKLQERLDNAKAEAGKNGTEEAKKHADASQDAMRQAASGQQQSGDRNSQAQKDSTKTGQQQQQPAPSGQQQPGGQPQSGQQQPGGQPQSGQSGQ